MRLYADGYDPDENESEFDPFGEKRKKDEEKKESFDRWYSCLILAAAALFCIFILFPLMSKCQAAGV